MRNVDISQSDIQSSTQYCSQDCKKEHAKAHKASCPPPHVPPTAGIDGAAIPNHPIFDTGVFWGNHAATDILNLAENEGAEYDGFLRLLLLGREFARSRVLSFKYDTADESSFWSAASHLFCRRHAGDGESPHQRCYLRDRLLPTSADDHFAAHYGFVEAGP